MHSDSDSVIRAENVAQGLRIKRNNRIAAFVSGLTLVLLSVKFIAPSRTGFLFGLLAGFVYANGFEYCVHRFLLHSGRGFLSRQHTVHHETLKSPDGARYVNFSSKPRDVVALFFANSLLFFFLEWLFHNGWVAGVFVSFTLYYVAFEEIHWRTHMGGWLPGWLQLAARHHLRHHAAETDDFNIFLPMFDWLVWQVSSVGRQNHVRL